jgi:hypothetical protein
MLIGTIKRKRLGILVMSCVVMFVSFVEFFHDDTVGTRPEYAPEPLRRFRTSHFREINRQLTGECLPIADGFRLA